MTSKHAIYKQLWCSHPCHANRTRSGSKPTHPVRRKLIDATQDEMVKIDSPGYEDSSHKKPSAKDKLNAIFQLLNMEKICDKF